MKRRTVIMFLACCLILGMSVFIGMTGAQPGPWKFLGHQDYQIVTMVDGRPVLFNDLREVDKRKIHDHVTRLLETDSAAADTWVSEAGKSHLRPDIVPPVKFYTVSARNELVRLDREVISISLGDAGEQETLKIGRLYVNGKAILVPADPGYGYRCFLSLPDHRRSLIPTWRGLWLVEPDKQVAVRVSADEYGGKTIDELENEASALRGDSPGPVLWWHSNPILSPDGDTVAFVTNRDCIKAGTSVWVNHLPSGKEYPLVRNTRGEHEHYRVDGWVDDSHLLAWQYLGGTLSYHLLALSGELTPLGLEGKSPKVVGIGPGGLVAYLPDTEAYRSDLYVVRLDLGDKSVSKVHEIRMQGGHRTTRNCPPFSPDGSRVAYVNAVDDGTATGTQILVVVDLADHEETVITARTKGTLVYDFDWIDGDRLLVRMVDREGELREISSWIYDLKGGK